MKKQILYIEDDPDMVELVVEIMRVNKYEVISDSGKTMYKLINDNKIGLILMDEGLGWCWGSSLCKELRANINTTDIPIIMISAAPDIEDIAQHCGANAYIRKPFDHHDIIDTVNNNYLKK